MNIAQSLERACQLFPHKPAILFEGKQLTYQQLNEMSNRIANGLAGLGIGKGDRVALFLPNMPIFVSAYYGIHKLGAIVVAINATLKTDEVKFILNDSDAKVVLTTETLRQHILEREIPSLQQIIIVEGRAVDDTVLAFDELIAQASSNAEAVAMARDDPAEILYTSGTTGFPKGATHSHWNVIFNVRATVLTFRMQPEDKVLLFLAAFHNFGMNTILTPCIDVCATLVLQREFDAEAVGRVVAEQNVSMFFGVPTIFTLLLEQLSAQQMQSVRFYLSAAANLPLEISHRWEGKFGKVIGEGYGLTECFLVTYNHYLKYQPGSIGWPFEGIELKVFDEEDNEVAPGELGEVVIRGPNVMLGYWKRPDETTETIRNSWFHTGDIGCMDENGYFYIVDRVKDMINVGGLKVYPSEVENILYKHSAILEAAVYGVQSPIMGEQVRAAIVLTQEQSAEKTYNLDAITPETILTFCRQHLADFKVPGAVDLVDELPKSPTGKILKRLLRAQVEHAASTDSVYPDFADPEQASEISYLPIVPNHEHTKAPKSQEDIEDWLATWVTQNLDVPPESIDSSTLFTEYGLTSVFAVNLVQGLSQWLEQSIQPVVMWSYPSIASLAQHLATQQSQAVGHKQDGSLSVSSNGSTIEPLDHLDNLETESLSDNELADLLAAEIALNQQSNIEQ